MRRFLLNYNTYIFHPLNKHTGSEYKRILLEDNVWADMLESSTILDLNNSNRSDLGGRVRVSTCRAQYDYSCGTSLTSYCPLTSMSAFVINRLMYSVVVANQ